VVRNGHGPERELQTGIGPIPVRRPKVRDRGDGSLPRLRFTSAVLPAYLRRTKNLEELLPWLYLKGISTGQFEPARSAHALHDAIRGLRDSGHVPLSAWVPFTHTGP